MEQLQQNKLIQEEMDANSSQVKSMYEDYLRNDEFQKINQLSKRLHQVKESPLLDKEFYSLFYELDRRVHKVYTVESNAQVNTLKKNGTNLKFKIENFLKIPKSLDVASLENFFRLHPQSLELLKIIELRSLASRNGFCLLTTDHYRVLTGKTRQTFNRQLKILERLQLISQINVKSSTKKKFYTIKVIRANRIFIKHFACGFKSRCNHLFFAKFLLPEMLTLGNQFPIKWRASKKSKHIPNDLAWAYELKYDPFDEYKLMKQWQVDKHHIRHGSAINMLGIEPYGSECHDRPSMYELFHSEAPFWSVEMQEAVRLYLRQQRAMFKIPFYEFGYKVILPKAFAWEMNSKRAQAIKHMPKSWIERTDQMIMSNLAKPAS